MLCAPHFERRSNEPKNARKLQSRAIVDLRSAGDGAKKWNTSVELAVVHLRITDADLRFPLCMKDSQFAKPEATPDAEVRLIALPRVAGNQSEEWRLKRHAKEMRFSEPGTDTRSQG